MHVAEAGLSRDGGGAVDRHLGLLATTMERFAEAERHFAQAIALNARLGARLLVAHTECDLAELLRRRGTDDRRARVLLEGAIRTYGTLELPHHAERAAARAVRARPIAR